MPGQHRAGYQRAYQAARSKTVSWVIHNLPAVWAAARGEQVDMGRVRDELRRLADDDNLEGP
jgi:hypothetical protein